MHGPIGQPAPSVIAVSSSSGVTRGLVEHAHAVVEQRDEHAVDDEPGRVVAAARPSCRAARRRRARSSTASSEESSARTISTSGISGAGLKKCMPDDALGRRRRGGDLRDGQRGGVRREDGVRRGRSARARAKSARLASSSSTIASITRSQSARSARSVVVTRRATRGVALLLRRAAPSRPCA